MHWYPSLRLKSALLWKNASEIHQHTIEHLVEKKEDKTKQNAKKTAKCRRNEEKAYEIERI